MSRSANHPFDREPKVTLDPPEPFPAPHVAVVDRTMKMTAPERARAAELDVLKRINVVAAYWYEGITLLLADDLRYTPDFLVQYVDGRLALEECKGPHIREDSLLKLRMCAERFPFPLKMYQQQKGATEWTVKVFR
jgi:hypothetical protein